MKRPLIISQVESIESILDAKSLADFSPRRKWKNDTRHNLVRALKLDRIARVYARTYGGIP